MSSHDISAHPVYPSDIFFHFYRNVSKVSERAESGFQTKWQSLAENGHLNRKPIRKLDAELRILVESNACGIMSWVCG